MSTPVIERVFARHETNLAAQEKFQASVGWRYGFLFGIVTVLAGWGVDASEQSSLFMEMPGVKLAIVAAVLVPMAMVAGYWAGRVQRKFIYLLLIWSILAGLMGVVGLLVSFAGPSITMMLFDPSVQGTWVYPITSGLIDRIPLVALFGVLLGVLAGGLQRLATTWAWDVSSADNRFTFAGWWRLVILVPVALVLGALYDGSVNTQFRAPFVTTQRIVRTAQTMPTGLDRQSMSTAVVLDYVVADTWRDHFSTRYTQRVAAFNPRTLGDVVVDMDFDNGFIWRCETTWGGYILKSCIDLGSLYTDLMKQLLAKGTAQCEKCSVRIADDAVQWRKQQGDRLKDPQQITAGHFSGSVVLVRAIVANGSRVECRFVGVDPIQIDRCQSF